MRELVLVSVSMEYGGIRRDDYASKHYSPIMYFIYFVNICIINQVSEYQNIKYIILTQLEVRTHPGADCRLQGMI